jgi:hypothetical protein
MLEPICFSLSDEVGHYEVIESLTESVHTESAAPLREELRLYFVCAVPCLVFSSVCKNKLNILKGKRKIVPVINELNTTP